MIRGTIAGLVVACALSSPVGAQETNVYWGDTHLHTGNSFDVYLFGTPTATPDTAYRFARGLPVVNPATGADFVAIPHNSNISLGQMFPLVRYNGQPVDAEYARKRMQWERLVEVTQIKGDSEAHPLFSPTDEFADYETYPFVLTAEGGTPDPGLHRSGIPP